MSNPISPAVGNGPDSPDPVGIGVGQSIKAARSELGISMRALAIRCGVGQPFLSEVERGLAMPSISTLYRIAEALDVAPSSLLPSSGSADVRVIRRDEGRRVASSERGGSAFGRVVFTNDSLGLEVYEYIADSSEDLQEWFEHAGHKVLHVIAGHLHVDFHQRDSVQLEPGDTLVHPGAVAHRWSIPQGGDVHLFLVVTRDT